MSECGCSSIATPGSLKPIEEARDLMLSHAKVVAGVERVAIADALGRVLAEPLSSQGDVPH